MGELEGRNKSGRRALGWACSAFWDKKREQGSFRGKGGGRGGTLSGSVRGQSGFVFFVFFLAARARPGSARGGAKRQQQYQQDRTKVFPKHFQARAGACFACGGGTGGRTGGEAPNRKAAADAAADVGADAGAAPARMMRAISDAASCASLARLRGMRERERERVGVCREVRTKQSGGVPGVCVCVLGGSVWRVRAQPCRASRYAINFVPAWNKRWRSNAAAGPAVFARCPLGNVQRPAFLGRPRLTLATATPSGLSNRYS